MDKEAVNQQLQFTAEILTNDTNLPPSAKKDKVQIMIDDEFPFLDMKMIWYPEEDLKFGVFRRKGQKFNKVGKGITHTPGILHEIPSGVLNHLANITLHKPSVRSERGENVYPNHVNALHKAGLAPPILPTMGELWKGQDEKMDLDKGKYPEVSKKKTEMYIFVLHTHVIFLHLSTGQLISKKNI